MAKPKTRIPLGDTQGKSLNNPFAKLAGITASGGDGPPADDVQTADTATQDGEEGPVKIGRFSVHAERKGRGGKTVTIVRKLGVNDAALQDMAKQMRHALGCGASVEENSLVLQGDQVERVREYLKRR